MRRENSALKGRNTSLSLLLCAIASCAVTTELSAATFLIDFGAVGNQTTSADSRGNLWNNLTGATAAPSTNPRSGTIALQDTSGDFTNGGTGGLSMDFSFRNNYPADPVANPIGADNANFSDKNSTNHGSLGSLGNLGLLDVDSVTRDVIWSAGAYTLTFTGLDETKLYNFNLFAYRSTAGRTSDYTIEGATDPASPRVDEFNVSTTNLNGGVIVSFLNQKPDDFGSMILTVGPGDTGGYAYLSALQITEVVPEPSSAILLLGGLSAFFLKRRR